MVEDEIMNDYLIHGDQYCVNSKSTLEFFKGFVSDNFDNNKYTTFYWKHGDLLSRKQQSALHKYCTLVADSLNNCGMYQYVKCDIFRDNDELVEVEWTQDSVKNLIWRPIQLALYPSVKSTAKLKSHEVTKVYEMMHNSLAKRSKNNVYVLFPSKDNKG